MLCSSPPVLFSLLFFPTSFVNFPSFTPSHSLVFSLDPSAVAHTFPSLEQTDNFRFSAQWLDIATAQPAPRTRISTFDIRENREHIRPHRNPEGELLPTVERGISNALDNLLLVFLLSCLFSPLLLYCLLFFFLLLLSFLHSNLDFLLHVASLTCQNVAILFLSFIFYLYIFIHFMHIHIYIYIYLRIYQRVTL